MGSIAGAQTEPCGTGLAGTNSEPVPWTRDEQDLPRPVVVAAAAQDTLCHPLGVRPSGNALTADQNLCDAIGSFQKLPDELLVALLEWLEAADLRNLGATCRAFYAYTTYDQLWRELWIRDQPALFDWRGSWRASYFRLPNPHLARVDCRNLFSDAIHRPFFCSQVSMVPYASQIPTRSQIPKLKDLHTEEFDASWSDRPFILTDLVSKWPIFHSWSESNLLKDYGDLIFRAEAVDWPLRSYMEYMRCTEDESPLYLFDRDFADKMGLKVGKDGDYWPPDCLGNDLFTLLGQHRPDHRWLIIGPARSGSTFHKDPNATSAWNAVVSGSKYWIMFPDSVTPPGVYTSEDQSEVTSPLSIAEWLLTFHEQARRMSSCMEGICHAGEVLHVPSGWWHLVVNLEPSIAITQNFVPESHLKPAMAFLKDKVGQVSGFRNDVSDPAGLFLEKLREQRPDLMKKLDNAISRKRKWQEVVHEGENVQTAGAFSFAFDEDIEDADV